MLRKSLFYVYHWKRSPGGTQNLPGVDKDEGPGTGRGTRGSEMPAGCRGEGNHLIVPGEFVILVSLCGNSSPHWSQTP
jgi:hypothetical protein